MKMKITTNNPLEVEKAMQKLQKLLWENAPMLSNDGKSCISAYTNPEPNVFILEIQYSGEKIAGLVINPMLKKLMAEELKKVDEKVVVK